MNASIDAALVGYVSKAIENASVALDIAKLAEPRHPAAVAIKLGGNGRPTEIECDDAAGVLRALAVSVQAAVSRALYCLNENDSSRLGTKLMSTVKPDT